MRFYDLPGHGSCMNEPLCQEFNTVLQDAYQWTLTEITEAPFVIFGHSLGSLIGWEVVQELVKNDNRLPQKFIASGHSGPSIVSKRKNLHSLPTKEFFNELRALGGLSEAFFEDPRLMELFEPILRADFSVVSSYQHPAPRPASIPITFLCGDKENLSNKDIAAWKAESLSGFSSNSYTGGHFHIYEHWQAIASILVS